MKETFLHNFIEELNRQIKLGYEMKKVVASYETKTLQELEDFLLSKKVIDIEDLTKIKATAWNLPYENLFGKNIEDKVFELIPLEVVENYRIICFDKDKDTIHVGIVSPENYQAIEALDFLGKKLGLDIQISVISQNSYNKALNEYQTLGEEVHDVMDDAEKKLEERFHIQDTSTQVEESVLKEAPITKIISVVIKHAVEGSASDIHIELVAKKTRIRYRIDGMLRTALQLPKYIHPALVARVKVMANMKLDETRLPQDGRIRVNVEGRDIDFRVSTMPTFESEKVVMRVLQNTTQVPTLKDLGFSEKNIELISENIKRPHGIFLSTGPTGSGKSTTLYSILNMLNSEGVNIVTLEDPIEYSINGVNQSQVRSELKYDFASGLRSLLRQDPNIIMVGEIRDVETAKMAVNAGLTGHLLFSTVHTNNAVGAIPRLIDMGVEPFLISSTLNLIIAQRLARRICQNCKKPVEIPKDLQTRIKKTLTSLPTSIKERYKQDISSFQFFVGAGCTMCGNTGYRGRIAVAEILQMTDSFKKIIYDGFSSELADKEIKDQEMMSLQQDALLRALQGLTSVEEVLRVTEE